MDAKEYGQKSWPTEPQWPELFKHTEDERNYVCSNFREMPKDWYPDEFYIHGKHKPYELGCTMPLNEDKQIDLEALAKAMKALRMAFWLKIETDRLQREFFQLNKER